MCSVEAENTSRAELDQKKSLIQRIRDNLYKVTKTREHLCHMALNDGTMRPQEAASILEITVPELDRWIDRFTYDVRFLKILDASFCQDLSADPQVAAEQSARVIENICKAVESYQLQIMEKTAWMTEIMASLAEYTAGKGPDEKPGA